MNWKNLTARYPQVFIAISVGLLCLWAIWGASRDGLSAFFSARGTTNGSVIETKKAVSLSPTNPDAHQARAAVLESGRDFAGAIAELKQALSLRGQDYDLWLKLGQMSDQTGDLQGTLAAYQLAVSCAPYYAEPRWQLGNLLLRTAQRDQAFAELRRAAISDPNLELAVINLAWRAYGEDAQAIQNAIRPQTRTARLNLAHSFVEHQKTSEAIALLVATNDIGDDDWQGLLDQLLNSRRFAEGYEVWVKWRETSGDTIKHGIAEITDGGFENRIVGDEHGFGWRVVTDLRGVSLAQDSNGPHAGSQSLRLDFDGDSDPTATIVSQYVRVVPKTRYRLDFAARTQEIVSGGLPIVVVTDISGRDERQLAQSTPLPQGTNEWHENFVEFSTANETGAIRIGLQRRPCNSRPCPIFGSLWLDDFNLQRL
jgi:hypothetical protein